MSDQASDTGSVVIALPSKGQLDEKTRLFLASCGLRVKKNNPRQYEARMASLPQVRVLFQRAEDIPVQVARGTADLGITGLDLVEEAGYAPSEVLVLHEALGYGHCELVIAVPEGWMDVDSMTDLTDMAIEFRQRHNRDLRVATKFVNLTRAFLYAHEISHFTIVPAHGAVEAAPALGYADVVSDLTATRTTLRENRLKEINGGTILHAQACLIGNHRSLVQKPAAAEVARRMLEQMEASLGGSQYYTVTTTMDGGSPENLLQEIDREVGKDQVSALSVTPLLPNAPTPRWTLSLLATEPALPPTVDLLRSAGCGRIVASPVRYLYDGEARGAQQLDARLKRVKHHKHQSMQL